MHFHRFIPLAVVLAFGLGAVVTARAQQHRATRLGDPETRFAPPLNRPEQLRTLLLDEKLRADVASILKQAGWRGDLEDLRRAAATAEIRDLELPYGTRMPFMSSRKNGRPVTLHDVLWVGPKPIQAYTFDFSSKGRRYRLITPRPCSNFYVVDLGEEPRPRLVLEKSAPAIASICEPMEVRLAVRNTGKAPAQGVRVTEALPAGWKSEDGSAEAGFDAGTLAPGEAREFRFRVSAAIAGTFTNVAHAATADRWTAAATAVTRVGAPELVVACRTPDQVSLAQPAEVCLSVTNVGIVPEPKVTLALPVPAGATVVEVGNGGTVTGDRIVWELSALAPNDGREVCARFSAREPVTLEFAPVATGSCAPGASSKCSIRVTGIPAILLEVVDLEDPVEVGQQVTYEIRVTNQGSATLTNVRFQGTLPESQEFVSGGGPTPVSAQERTLTTEPLPALDPKAEAVWRVVAKALTASDARFGVELTSDQHRRPVPEFEATTQY